MGPASRRTDREYDHPAYPLDQVVDLVRRQFIHITTKASNEAARYFGDDSVYDLRPQIVEALQLLTREEWYCRQVKNGVWVDIYRADIFTDWPPAWIKLRIDEVNRYLAVVLISFHEFDDD